MSLLNNDYKLITQLIEQKISSKEYVEALFNQLKKEEKIINGIINIKSQD